MSLLILSSSDIQKITKSISPDDLISLSSQIFSLLSSSSSNSNTPHRTSIQTPSHTILFMPSRVPSLNTTAIKIVSVPTREEDKRGLPASTILIDEESGRVKALLNARSLTALRTAAGSLLATHLLLKNRAPHSLVMFGAGAQAQAHITLHLQSYPSIKLCTIINRTSSQRFHSLTSALRAQFPNVEFRAITNGEGKEECLREADIICTATPSLTPLFSSTHLKQGVHINLVGSYKPSMHEVDHSVLGRAKGRIVVDKKEAVLEEAGEFIDAGIEGEDLVELGELVNEGGSLRPGKEDGNGSDITIFKSVGVGIQDVGIAKLVVERAEKMGIGRLVEGYDGDEEGVRSKL